MHTLYPERSSGSRSSHLQRSKVPYPCTTTNSTRNFYSALALDGDWHLGTGSETPSPTLLYTVRNLAGRKPGLPLIHPVPGDPSNKMLGEGGPKRHRPTVNPTDSTPRSATIPPLLESVLTATCPLVPLQPKRDHLLTSASLHAH